MRTSASLNPSLSSSAAHHQMAFASEVLHHVLRNHFSCGEETCRKDGSRVNFDSIMLHDKDRCGIPIFPASMIWPDYELGRGGEGVAELAKLFGLYVCVRTCKCALSFSSGPRQPFGPLQPEVRVDSLQRTFFIISVCCAGLLPDQEAHSRPVW